MNFGDPALSHVLNAMEASSSSTDLVFRIADGSNLLENDVRITQPDRLRRWSLGLRRLMEDGGISQQVSLKVDPKYGFDSAAVAWVLEKLQRQDLDVRPDPETLARHCAVLWKYECIPDPFQDLGNSMQPRSSLGSPSIDQRSSIAGAPSTSPSGSSGSRSWRGKKNNDTCGQLLTIAMVLGIPEVLEDEIKTAVWGTNKEVKVAVPLEQVINIEAIRKQELGKLFDKVFHKICEINYANEKLGKSIRETLKQHNLGDFSMSWKKNAKELEKDKWTPYDFLRGMENALAPEPPTQIQEPRAQVRARAKDAPHVNWAHLFRKTTKAMKDNLHVITGKEVGGDQERKDGILDSLEDLIQEHYHALAAELMVQRSSIVLAWKYELNRLDGLSQQAQT